MNLNQDSGYKTSQLINYLPKTVKTKPIFQNPAEQCLNNTTNNGRHSVSGLAPGGIWPWNVKYIFQYCMATNQHLGCGPNRLKVHPIRQNSIICPHRADVTRKDL